MSARRAAWLVCVVLLAAYVATMAPSVTFWDAGEFIAAAHALGIPHPPGTPLFVVMLNVWARAFWWLPFAQATNLFSAVATATAIAITTWWIGRATNDPWCAVAAGLACGAMSSVWSNATETEVYAASLFLAMASVVSGDLAGRTGERRWLILTAYLLALSVPLHLSSLVAAPAVILLATERADGTRSWSEACALLGVTMMAAGVSRLSMVIVTLGIGSLVASAFLDRRTGAPRTRAMQLTFGTVGVTLVAASALFFLLVRAKHDPAINQGNASSLANLAAVVSRSQYDVAGLWPRRAPVWLQLANWFEYADWQTGLSLAPTVIPTTARVAVTIGFAGLGLYGALWHRATDTRTWRALVLLFAGGSLGVIAYLNLKAGASFGLQFIPEESDHEARDRDYFFVLGFVAWGLWAGMGAVALARRMKLRATAGVLLAALPIALNWSAVSRRSEPEASLPRLFAAALLDSLPRRAVLFVAGDNDTYPLWFAQQVERRRRDVTIVTIPLMEADWYADEMGRRNSFGSIPMGARGARTIADAARAAGRPVAVALTVATPDRAAIGGRWIGHGAFAVDESVESGGARQLADSTVTMDVASTSEAANAIAHWLHGMTFRPAIDPTDEYVLGILACPRLSLISTPSNAQVDSLASTCNLR